MLRKIISFAVVTALLFTLSACRKNSAENTPEIPENNTSTTAANTTQAYNETPDTTAATTETTQTTQVQSTEIATTAAPVTETTTLAVVTQDFSDWDTAKILEFYKNAAATTGSTVTSSQKVEIQDISVNNGQLGGMFSFVTPILSSFIASSTTETVGITGNFSALTTADISSANISANAENTVVEILLNPQTDNAASAGSDGSVARGISVVGDLGTVILQLKEKGLPLDIPVENAVITYTTPLIKAVVDKDGKIINGTWSCTVEISITNYKFAGSDVDSTKVILGNTFTVGGGFNP